MGSLNSTDGTGQTGSEDMCSCVNAPKRTVKSSLGILAEALGYIFQFLFWRRGITFRQARQIRAAVIRDRRWRWWHFGFLPWFALNFMLATFDRKKEELSTTIKSGRRAIDSVCKVREACRKDQDIHTLFDLWGEFTSKDSTDFNQRNRKFFMNRMGNLFSDPAKLLLREAMTMVPHDYLVLKYLCCKSSRVLAARVRKIGEIECSLVDFFIAHKDMCCNLIVTFRSTVLDMAKRYTENMIALCLEHPDRLESTAHLWAKAGRKIVHIQELDITDDSIPVILRELDEFFALVDEASSSVYMLYLDEAKAAKIAKNTPPGEATQNDDPKTLESMRRWPTLHKGKLGRFKFEWNDAALTITDTKHREDDHSFVKFEDITADSELDIIEGLMVEFANGYGHLIKPLSRDGWQANVKSDAARDFIGRESQTWAEARPGDAKEAKRLHNRYRRIIPDGQPLRVRK